MNSILLAVLIVSAIGLIAGVGLAVASVVMAVPVDEKAEAIRECLPGANCGACGFSGCDGYAAALSKGITKNTALCAPGGNDVSAQIAEIAALTGSLPRLLQVLPKALEEGLTNYFENWNYVIEDIYALNPDVTLVVVGMFDTSLQAETTAGGGLETAIAGLNIGQTISDIANIPMKEGAEKYGYILIEPKGIECEKQHPGAKGHRQIADLILEALPDASFRYKDVDVSSKNYKAIEALSIKGIMEGVSETEFAPDAALTKAQLSAALNKISGAENAAGTNGNVNRINMATSLISASFSEGLGKAVKTIGLAVKLIINNGKFDLSATVTRGDGAAILYNYMSL